jgi:hypothetical protein
LHAAQALALRARHVPVASLKASKKEKELRKANSLADWIKKML